MTATISATTRMQERDTIKALEGVSVGLATHLERLNDALETYEGIDSAITNLRTSIREAEELRELVLSEHRDTHAEVSPRFCSSEVCRKAAGEQ